MSPVNGGDEIEQARGSVPSGSHHRAGGGRGARGLALTAVPLATPARLPLVLDFDTELGLYPGDGLLDILLVDEMGKNISGAGIPQVLLLLSTGQRQDPSG